MASHAQHFLKFCFLSFVSIRSATTHLSPPATLSLGTLFSGKVCADPFDLCFHSIEEFIFSRDCSVLAKVKVVSRPVLHRELAHLMR